MIINPLLAVILTLTPVQQIHNELQHRPVVLPPVKSVWDIIYSPNPYINFYKELRNGKKY
jgi:hypothetical protein